MKIRLSLLVLLFLISFNANAQDSICGEGESYGCGSFNLFKAYPSQPITLCGCFKIPDDPIERDVSIKSCRSDCPIYDGLRTRSGCQCLRGPIEIPDDLESPTMRMSELKALYKLKLKNPNLYELYLDTQLNQTTQPALPVDKFFELSK